MPLPNAFPKEAARVLINFATSAEKPTTSQLVTASYELVGYGLFLGFGDGQPLIGDDEEAIQLKSQLAQPEVLLALQQALPPVVMTIILALIQKFLEKLVK